jgi:hypothetical protein
MAISLGASNETVHAVQRILVALGYRFLHVRGVDGKLVCISPRQDGVFGPQTQAVLMDFQRDNALLVDGVIGKTTMAALEAAYARRRLEIDSPGTDALDAFDRSGAVSLSATRLPFIRVPADRPPGFEDACEALQLRSDVARAYGRVYNALRAAGAVMIASAGRRALDTPVSAFRSALSFNHLGRAVDLFPYSGMVDTDKDPYVIELPEDGSQALAWRDAVIGDSDPNARAARSLEPPAPWFWRVWARCRDDVDPATVPKQSISSAVTYLDRWGAKRALVEGRFIDLTALFAAEGFKPVSPRPLFFDFDGAMMNANWWRFQYEAGLVPEVSTYGGELLRVYAEATLAGTLPWQYRRAVYGHDW